MFDVNQIYNINDFLSNEEWEICAKESERYSWGFQGFSTNPNDRIFWKKDFWGSLKCDVIDSIFKSKIDKIFNIKCCTQDLYLNAQAHGQCGSFHKDIEENKVGDYITLVYYPLAEWKPEWGGFTLIIDNNKNLHTIYPKPNTAVIFNSKFDHVGLEPTIHCNTQRVSLAHKFKIAKD